jgi:hypothetical protein
MVTKLETWIKNVGFSPVAMYGYLTSNSKLCDLSMTSRWGGPRAKARRILVLVQPNCSNTHASAISDKRGNYEPFNIIGLDQPPFVLCGPNLRTHSNILFLSIYYHMEEHTLRKKCKPYHVKYK